MKTKVILLLLLCSVAASAHNQNATNAATAPAKATIAIAAMPIGGAISKMVSEAVGWFTRVLRD
ncbi:hypothetical protein HYN48_10935 [Flavobacterium magnum]|uniref:Uncharacterized protein n=1 Tax=Flavobacterium magnum TaxID=2162713 RepID=A0A2S0RIK7_9FLAO|nr:hypothetical protein [Flavobacterium magnum]AWA30562.1 hypothetical protein HYN48_10935 [Flavobacterium magnum]